MEFQILDVDYVNLNDKPIVRFFGKTEKGESVCVFYEGFRPYFYAAGEGVREALADDPEVVDIEDADRRVVGSHKMQKVFKITTRNPAKTPDLREKLRASGITVYEADILFKYRVMNDMGLAGMGWVRTEGDEFANTETVKADKKFTVKRLVSIEKEGNADLKYLAFDIECTSSTGMLPDPKKDPVIMVSLVFSHPFEGKDSVVLSTRKGDNVQSFDSENEMLEEFVRIVQRYDPDIMTGYNCNNFDFPFILDRMYKLDVKPFLGRCMQKRTSHRKIGIVTKVNLTGRIVLDSFAIVKKDFSLQRYSLNFVAGALLNQSKEDVKHSEIEKFWRGSDEEFRKLAEYCRTDSRLALNLVLKMNLTDKHIALSKVSGTLLQDTLDSGETTRIENYMLRVFNKEGYVFPCKPDDATAVKRGLGRKEELGGGAVLEPIKGLHSSVAVLDFKSMYPTIIRSFNICPTTKVRPGQEEEAGAGKEDLIATPSGARFLKTEKRKGIVPGLLENLMNERGAVKKAMKGAKGEAKQKELYAKQWALKIMANAMYGYFGYARSKLFDLDIANSITSIGRETIHSTKDVVEKKYGYTIVYGDTDSVFAKLKGVEDMDKMGEIADKIAADITGNLLGSMELEFEKIFKRFLPLTKKRYAAWKFERTKEGWKEGIEMKGIETVRRDWCKLVGETLREVIEIILKKEDVKGAVKYFKTIIDDLLANKIDTSKLIITKTMTKAPRHYKGIQPHIELVTKMKARNAADAPGIGDRIEYVIVKGKEMLSKRAEDPTYVKETGLQIDASYYIDNQLMPPLERIFGAMGITKSELMGGGKQVGLLDILKQGRPSQEDAGPKVLKEIKKEEMTGFLCSKCSKHYPRMPLMGTCGCGGQLNFASAGGPAEAVVN